MGRVGGGQNIWKEPATSIFRVDLVLKVEPAHFPEVIVIIYGKT
jgi:hypothetical protein